MTRCQTLYTMWLGYLDLSTSKNFGKSTILLKSDFTKYLHLILNLTYFYTPEAQCGKMTKDCQINYLEILLSSKTVTFTKILPKKCEKLIGFCFTLKNERFTLTV